MPKDKPKSRKEAGDLRSPALRAAEGGAPDQPTRNKAPIKLQLIVTIVNKKKGEFYRDLIQSFDVNFQFYALASGTARADVLNYLGMTETDKLVIFSIAREDRVDDILYALEQKFDTIRNGKGVAAVIPLSSMIGTSVYTFLCNALETATGGNAK